MTIFRHTLCLSALFVGLSLLGSPSYGATKKAASKVTVTVGDSAAIFSQRHDLEIGKAMETFFNIFREVNLYYVDSTSPREMIKGAGDAMLEELDPYTEYLPREEMADFETMTTGKYAGLGALIRKSNNGGWIEIAEPYRGTPSDNAGLKAGDRIISVDGIPMQGREVAFASDRMKGKAGTVATIAIRPIADTNTLKTITVKRERITVPAVPYYGWVADSVGYIRLNSFTENCAAEVKNALVSLQSTGRLHGLILDLRDNTGGILGEAVKIVSLFTPRGTTVVTTRGRVPEMNATYRTVGSPVLEGNVPLAVLINSASASASEIVAGSLQDLDRAVVIGQRSFGKGLVQSTRPVGDNEYIKLTTAKYYTPSGRCIQAMDYTHRNEDGSIGVVPDSLVQTFRTTGGRAVYDGGGIMPDIKLVPEYLSKFTAILIGLGHVDDFANRYATTHPAESIATFVVTDSMYAHFCSFMANKPINFESGTERKLTELRRAAEREKYADRITAELDAIALKIKDDKEAELVAFAPEIREVLAQAIITRWHYNAGRIEYLLRSDKTVDRTMEILNPGDRGEYNRIVTIQDTDKK